MTEEQIREVLTATQDYMLSRLPKAEWNYQFSPRFRRNMKKLIKRDKHRFLYSALRMTAIIAISLFICGGMVLGFNKEARANVRGWFFELFLSNEYRYQKEGSVTIDITKYSLEDYAPEGFTLIDRKETADKVNEVYVNENGALLFFTVLSSGDGVDFYVISDENKPNDLAYIGKTKADLFISANQEEPNAIVWQGKGGVLLCIQGVLDKKQLIDLAKKIEDIS